MTDTLAPVITIDGPSGSGKGTVARLIAQRYGFHLLDSGALYRITALEADRRGINFDDEQAVINVSLSMQVTFALNATEGVSVFLGGDDVTRQVRAETCAMQASKIAPMPSLRAALLDVQRDFRKPPGLVADGRDMGTAVFADAEVKIFLTASAEQRALRRFKQLQEKGFKPKIDNLSHEIIERDERDQNRALSPLRAADDAHHLDSTSLPIDAVVNQIVQIVDKCFTNLYSPIQVTHLLQDGVDLLITQCWQDSYTLCHF